MVSSLLFYSRLESFIFFAKNTMTLMKGFELYLKYIRRTIMEHVNTDTNFENLGITVGAEAGIAYLKARLQLDHIKKEIKLIRQFFTSGMCKDLTEADGKKVLIELDRFYNECRDTGDFKTVKAVIKDYRKRRGT